MIGTANDAHKRRETAVRSIAVERPSSCAGYASLRHTFTAQKMRRTPNKPVIPPAMYAAETLLQPPEIKAMKSSCGGMNQGHFFSEIETYAPASKYSPKAKAPAETASGSDSFGGGAVTSGGDMSASIVRFPRSV